MMGGMWEEELAARMGVWWRGEVALPVDDAVAWLRGQRLLALMGWRAEQTGWDLPIELAHEIRLRRIRIGAGLTWVEQQLRALGETALELGITVVLVKGAAAGQVYPAPWMRPFGDIDLLAGPGETQRLFEALLAAGYEQEAGTEGMRGWHLPPLVPPGGRATGGTRVEIHPALAQEGGRWLFTLAEWQDGLQPLPNTPGLWVPAAVDHALYIVHHAVIHHELEMGLQGAADLWFLTAGWGEGEWEALANAAEGAGMTRAVGLLAALTAWFWDAPDYEGARRFPTPPDEVLAPAQGVMAGVRRRERMPRAWRDAESWDLRGALKYLRVVLLGDTGQLSELPLRARVRYHMKRPAELWRNHGPAVWGLLTGKPAARDAWAEARALQGWLRGEKSV